MTPLRYSTTIGLAEQNPSFNLIQWSSLWHEDARSNILLRNTIPGMTTLHACTNLPMRDKRSRFRAAFHFSHV